MLDRLIVVWRLGMKLQCACVLAAYFVFYTNAWKALVEARIEYGEAPMLVEAIVRLAEAEQASNVHMMVGLGSFNMTDAMLNSNSESSTTASVSLATQHFLLLIHFSSLHDNLIYRGFLFFRIEDM